MMLIVTVMVSIMATNKVIIILSSSIHKLQSFVLTYLAELRAIIITFRKEKKANLLCVSHF